jgi:hypothetical protein
MESFGEKSYFYRKTNGLPPADVGALEEEATEVDADEV